MTSTMPSTLEDIRPISISQLAGYVSHCLSDILLIDERPRSLFKECHILGAVNLFCSPLMLRKVQRSREGAFKTFINESVRQEIDQKKFSTIIFYREHSKLKNPERRIHILRKLLPVTTNEKRYRYLEGGFEKFAKKFPALTESCRQESKDVAHLGLDLSEARHCQDQDPTDACCIDFRSDPVEILPFLYLGTAEHAADEKKLKCLGISSLMNVSKSGSSSELNDFDHKRIPVNDSNTENISCYFDEAITYIERIRNCDGKVLVHCKAGISRSATICLAYLIFYLRMTFDEAYDYIKTRRSVISPNFNFLGQLLAFESKLSRTQPPSGMPSPTSKLSIRQDLPRRHMEIISPVPQSPSCFTPKTESKFCWNDLR